MLQSLIPMLGAVFDRVLPDPIEAGKAKVQVMELVRRGELATLTAETQLALGQVEVNKAESASGDRWAAGWRPLVGYVCAVALAWDTILKPMVIVGAAVVGHPLPAVPDLSSDQLYGLLGGMLGLGGLSTVEKVKRAA